jgi:hypothetical protein
MSETYVPDSKIQDQLRLAELEAKKAEQLRKEREAAMLREHDARMTEHELNAREPIAARVGAALSAAAHKAASTYHWLVRDVEGAASDPEVNKMADEGTVLNLSTPDDVVVSKNAESASSSRAGPVGTSSNTSGTSSGILSSGVGISQPVPAQGSAPVDPLAAFGSMSAVGVSSLPVVKPESDVTARAKEGDLSATGRAAGVASSGPS